MLTLPMQSKGELVVLGDHLDPARAHVARAEPKLSVSATGRPSLRLTHWISLADPGAEQREVGGHLFVEIDMEPTAAELAAAQLGDRDVRPMPWLEAYAELDGAGLSEGTQGLRSEVSVVAGGRAAFAVRLTPLQVSALAPLLSGDNASPLSITWVGYVQARLPEVEVRATVDIEELRAEASRGNTTLIREQVRAHARIELPGGTNAELEEALTQWALDELTRRIADGESNLLIHAEAADVVRWPVRLSSTLALPDDRSGLVTAMTLAPDELGPAGPVRVQVRGGFDRGVTRVEVQLRDAQGAVKTVARTDETETTVAMEGRSYDWRHRVITDRPQAWSSWQDGLGLRELVLPVVMPPTREIEVMVAGLDLKDRWATVQVTLRSTGDEHASVSKVIVLEASHRAETWRPPATLAGAPIQWTASYVARNGVAHVDGPHEVANDQVVLRDPFAEQRLSIAVLPKGAIWSRVALAMVDLRHEDGDQVDERAVELRELADFVEVELPVRVGAPKTIRWRVHASFDDGGFSETAWTEIEDDVVLVEPAEPT